MVADRGGVWFEVVEELERRWMDPVCGGGSDGEPFPRPSVRATLDMSLALLPDAVCWAAFAAIGILPVWASVSVLGRLWRPQLDAAAATGRLPPEDIEGADGAALDAGVRRMVDVLVRVELLRRDVYEVGGVLVGVIVHPVVGEYARSLLDSTLRTAHQRLVDDYMAGVNAGGVDADGWRNLRFRKVPDDGYWYDNVARHVVAAADVCGLVCMMGPRWNDARMRACSPLAFQADVVVVIPLLQAVADNAEHQVARKPVMLRRVTTALRFAYSKRVAGSRRCNTESAFEHAKRALGLVSKAKEPLLWASLQCHLGTTYMHRKGGGRAANVQAAMACHERALELRTPEAAPLKWASTQNSLGIAYADRVLGDRASNVEAAVACYERALEVRTRGAVPLDWANSQLNLGDAYTERVCGDKAGNVEAAVVCYERALEVWTREVAPLDWASTPFNLAIAYTQRVCGDKVGNMEAAVACYERSLEVRTRGAVPLDWANSQLNLGDAYTKRVCGDKVGNMEAAVACYERALEVWTREAAPLDWAISQLNLGDAYTKRVCGDKSGNMEAAVACYERALEVWTQQASPQQWGDSSYLLFLSLKEGKRLSAAVVVGRALLGFCSRWLVSAAKRATLASLLAQLECELG